MRVLFVRPYTHVPGMDVARASDALGFGITCADALIGGLQERDIEVDTLAVPAGGAQPESTDPSGRGHRGPLHRRISAQTTWLARSLEAFEDAVSSVAYDALLAFHAFWPFSADLRRILDDSGQRCPFVTYTHGSHWDPTDLFRFERYPSLRWADLGNLLAADRILTVSRYMSDTLVRTVRNECGSAARELEARIRSIGLPLDLARIDAARVPDGDGPPTVVFNHDLIAAKQPGVFLAVAAELLRRTSSRVLLTRRVPPESPWSRQVADLCGAYPDRFVLGDDMAIDDYYAALWASAIQVSTASHESLGVATLEAMATGNCCLLPRIGSYPELVDGDPDVLYDHPADLLARLHRLVDAPHLRAPIAARHAARARARYSPERIAAAVHDVLLEAIATVL